MSTPVPKPPGDSQHDSNRRVSEGDISAPEQGKGLHVQGLDVPEFGNAVHQARVSTTADGQLDIDVSQFNRLHLSTEPHATYDEPSYILPNNPYWQEGQSATSPYSQQPPPWAGSGYQGFPPMYSPASSAYAPSPSVYYPPNMYARPPAGSYYHSQAPHSASSHQSNPSPPHLSRPSTAQTQASYHTGEFASPPMSPVMGSSQPRSSQSMPRDSRQGSWNYDEQGRVPPPSAWQQQQPAQFMYYPHYATGNGYPDANSASSEGWASVAPVSPVMGHTPSMPGGWQMPNQGWNQFQVPPQRHFVPRPPPPMRPYGSYQFGTGQDHFTPATEVSAPRAASVAGHGNGEAVEKERERKAYHPQAPAKRSEWVMWVGNVPNNVSHEELWRFFTSMVPPPLPNSDLSSQWQGPSSIFLISRSSCAFVNLSSADDLDRAVVFFNGRSLRPWDQRCPRLVCRVRKKDDDLKAGVGGQRGMGMHRAWVKSQAGLPDNRPADIRISSPEPDRERLRSEDLTPQNGDGPVSRGERSASGSVPPSPAVGEHPPDGEGRRRESLLMHEAERKERERQAGVKHQSTGSNASTSSSFLVRNFPRRFFILKSMTVGDLQESVQTGTWSTQKHNEPILDQAFRTSPEVYLIFSANRSGEFFGYARMTEASNKQDRRNIAFSARLSDETRPSKIEETDESSGERPKYLFSPTQIHVASSSPSELTPATDDPSASAYLHAPGERHTDPHQYAQSPSLIDDVGSRSATLDPNVLRSKPSYFPAMSKIDFGKNHSDPHLDSRELHRDDDDDTPGKAVAEQQARGSSGRAQVKDEAGVLHKDTLQTPDNRAEPALGADQAPLIDGQAESWGAPFKIEWIRVGSLPFTRLRHLRNPWNGDKEVKVSRDGTEVEPVVGGMLIAEWDKDSVRSPQISYTPHALGSLAEHSPHAIRA